MAGPYGVMFDPSADDGSKLDPAVVAEIVAVAPSTVTNGSITTAKLKDGAVTYPKMAPGAVHSDTIGTGEVKAVNLNAGSVTATALDADSVTGAKAGVGTVTSLDSTDSFVELKVKFVTAAQYAALTPDPNTEYHISA